jgi:hypothetical protein
MDRLAIESTLFGDDIQVVSAAGEKQHGQGGNQVTNKHADYLGIPECQGFLSGATRSFYGAFPPIANQNVIVRGFQLPM